MAMPVDPERIGVHASVGGVFPPEALRDALGGVDVLVTLEYPPEFLEVDPEWVRPSWDRPFTVADETLCVVGLGALGRGSSIGRTRSTSG